MKMTEMIEDKGIWKVIPIKIPRLRFVFARIENIIYGIRELEKHRKAIPEGVIGWDYIRCFGLMPDNYRIMPLRTAEETKQDKKERFDYITLDVLLEEKEEIEKAQRGEQSRYKVRNGLVIGDTSRIND